MRRHRIAKICMAVCLMLGVNIIPANQLMVQAEESVVTVSGTILSGTTAELLKLSTKEGDMEIKLDSGTDTSTCKILLPEKKISVSVSRGSDGYLHAVKVSSEAPTPGVSIDASTTAVVTGTIGEKTTDNLLYLNTDQGEMQIKLDVTTGMSGCSVLVLNKTYSINCARGSDAYMHAISISDSTASAPSVPPAGTGSTGGGNAATMSVTGTVNPGTKEERLYLATKEGEMQLVIDSSTDTSKALVLTKDNKLTVSFYHGSDGYLHAVTITGTKDGASDAEIDASATATVKGTVGSESNQNILYLDTEQGTMELKLDVISSLNNCKVLVSGRKLSVTCARGSDAYMHALTVTGE